jgi:arabinogalactan endo-1,4-beta-galactosidase
MDGVEWMVMASISLPSQPNETAPALLPFRGADVSSLARAEEVGAKYYDEHGIQAEALQILQDHGVNSLRLRVWVNPANGCNAASKVARFAQKVKSKGLKLLIDLHYSDTWADPEHQLKPAAWAQHSFSQLQADVYEHTRNVLNHLRAVDATPDMVQIGNEINPGMLLPDGSTANWEALAALLKQGCAAVKDHAASIQVMLHIANAGDQPFARKWFNEARAHAVSWDVTGLSYYSYWHGGMPQMTATVKELVARYGKPVVIVETAYPFTLLENDQEQNSIHLPAQLTPGYPATPAGQAANLRAVVQAARLGGALGFCYWEPTWTAVPGNGWDPTNPSSGCQWENQALFDFTGKALPAMQTFMA